MEHSMSLISNNVMIVEYRNKEPCPLFLPVEPAHCLDRTSLCRTGCKGHGRLAQPLGSVENLRGPFSLFVWFQTDLTLETWFVPTEYLPSE